MGKTNSCYGGEVLLLMVMDAVMLSKLTGRTVRVQYMRNDCTGWDPEGPAGIYHGRMGMD